MKENPDLNQNLFTSRLRLEPMLSIHAASLFDLFQDHELFQYMTRTAPTDRVAFREGLVFLEKRLSRDKKEYWLNWVSYLKESEQIVGKVEVSLIKSSGEAHLAYTTFRKFWNHGYAKEACAIVIQHVFADWNASKIIIEMDVRNTASIRLAESLGARQVSFNPRVQLLKGEWSDEYRYELNRNG